MIRKMWAALALLALTFVVVMLGYHLYTEAAGQDEEKACIRQEVEAGRDIATARYLCD